VRRLPSKSSLQRRRGRGRCILHYVLRAKMERDQRHVRVSQRRACECIVASDIRSGVLCNFSYTWSLNRVTCIMGFLVSASAFSRGLFVLYRSSHFALLCSHRHSYDTWAHRREDMPFLFSHDPEQIPRFFSQSAQGIPPRVAQPLSP
jgi:hypothetical protein